MSIPEIPKILVIDDDRAVRKSIAGFLEDLNYRVVEAENGMEGLELYERTAPDLVLVDLRMPEMDGIQVLDMISKKSPDTPLIVVSGTGVISDAVEALRRGAWDYLLKPIEDMSVLVHAVDKALERARLIMESRRHSQGLEELVAKRTAELTRTYEDLAASEERYRLLAENVTDNIWILDLTDLHIVYTSPSVERILGFSPREAMAISLEALVDPASLELIREVLAEEFTQSVNHDVDPDRSRAIEITMRHKSGRSVQAEITARFIHDKDGRPVRILGITRDISERIELETQVRQSQKMETVGRLAGGLAHDFNNLLTPILTYSELLLMDIPKRDPRHNDLMQIKEAADRAKNLTRRLLAFGRKQVFEMKVFDLGKLISNFQGILRRTIPENIDIVLHVETRCLIKGDPSQIEQILMNLAINAWDAMPDGGKLIIEVGIQLEDDVKPKTSINLETYPRIALRFTDTGSGMEPEVRERAFEPFFTTKEIGKGTGLGLATVYGIVEKHNGNIAMTSEKGKGTTFEIHFPAAADQIMPADKTSRDRQRQQPGNETILLVEDHDLVRKMANTILTQQGYDVIVSESPDQALKQMKDRNSPVHLLLTDVIMPGMNGRELHQKLLNKQPSLKVIFMSGYAENVIANEGVIAEGINFLSKPFDAWMLTKKVRDVLDSWIPGQEPSYTI
ncbi:MAG: response regulator [Proteobacteria bacterium]|nr:response regulator [Pseudomonadota bacterium]